MPNMMDDFKQGGPDTDVARRLARIEKWIREHDGDASAITALGYSDLMHLHMDGENNTTFFTDEKENLWTPHGNAKISTAQSKFGGAAAYFDGTGDWIDTPDFAGLNVAGLDWCVDFWLYLTSVAATRYIFGQTNAAFDAADTGIFGSFDSGTGQAEINFYDGAVPYTATAPSVLIANTWYHYAGFRSGTEMYCAIGGVLSVPADVTGATVNNSTSKFSIGRVGAYASNTMIGYIDELLFRRGQARFPTLADFDPPTLPYG